MKQLKALVISNKKIANKILNWELDRIQSVEDALAILQQQNYRIIAINNAIPETEKHKLEAIAKLFNNSVSVISYATEEELRGGIKQAFRNQKRKSLNHNYMDNAFEMELACKLKIK